MKTYQNYVNREWVSGQFSRNIINPFNGETIALVTESARKDVEQAIRAAREAFDRGDDRHGAVPVQVALGQPELSVAPCLGDGWRSPKGVRVGLCALLNSEKLLLSDNFGEPLQ